MAGTETLYVDDGGEQASPSTRKAAERPKPPLPSWAEGLGTECVPKGVAWSEALTTRRELDAVMAWQGLPGSGQGGWRHAVCSDWRQLELAPAGVREDRETVLNALTQNPEALKHATAQLRADKTFVLEAVRVHGRALEHADASLRADADVVREAVEMDGRALRFASDDLRADTKLVVLAMRPQGHTLWCSAEDLKAPSSVVREAGFVLEPDRWKAKIARDWGRLALAPPDVKGDPAIVTQAVDDSWGEALQHASEHLRADRDMVCRAVRLSGVTLRHASEELQGDLEIVMEAVRESWQALRYASITARGDRAVVEAALVQTMEAIEHVSEILRGDRGFMLRCVKCDPNSLKYASVALRTDRSFVFEAAKHSRLALRHVPENVRQEVLDTTMNIDTKWNTTQWLDVPERTLPDAVAC